MQKNSKIILAILAIISLVSCGEVQENEKGIRKTIQEYQEAYNNQDFKRLASLWSTKASYFNPVTGESAEGREGIEKLFEKRFSEGSKKHIEIVVNEIEFSNSDEAIEEGVITVTAPDQSKKQYASEFTFIKENDKWLFNAINEIELQQPISNFEELKDLAWLVGKWKDTDDNVEILFDNQWDKNKNFITVNFSMKVYGQDNIEGKQIITWDPAQELIRSWVFDSDGGFGEGAWEKVDNSWYAAMHYTLSDGRLASSKNVYTPIDDKSYTFASIDREVDGEILPNMDPVTVEKIN